jgi:hypothetical protein
VNACKSGERDTIRTWAADWIESLASALKTSDGDRRAWFDQRINQIEEFAWKKLSASDRRTGKCTLADAQFVIARVHGFKSWPQFAKHINALTRTTSPFSQFESAVGAIITGDGDAQAPPPCKSGADTRAVAARSSSDAAPVRRG